MRAVLLGLGLSVALTAGAQEPQRITVGATIRGTLAAGDRQFVEDRTYFDDYLIRLEQGQRIEVRMQSDAFDAYSGIGRWDGTEIIVMMVDDDGEGGGSTNSRFVFTAPVTADYAIRANSYAEGGLGPYTLSVLAAPANGEQVLRPISVGATMHDSLTSADPVLEDNSHYHLWMFEAAPGTAYVITMESEALDSFLQVGLLGDQLLVMGTNDDIETGNTNARVVVTAPGTVHMVIRANTRNPGETGTYRLTVQEQE